MKKEGETVKWSEVFVKRQEFLESQQIESPVDGVIEKIDLISGMVIIREIIKEPEPPIVLDKK